MPPLLHASSITVKVGNEVSNLHGQSAMDQLCAYIFLITS